MRRLIVLVLCCGLLLAGISLHAQSDNPPVFATNTPPPPEVVISTPAALVDDYGLRRWTEEDLLDLLQTYLQQPGVPQTAVRLLQFELQQHFPGAPHDPVLRESLLRAMLAAPVGTVDMRRVTHPTIEEAVNLNAGESVFTYNGFLIEVESINLDGTGEPDAMIHALYTLGNNETIYEDYLLARRVNGRYERLETVDLLPVAPLMGSISLVQVADFNGDGVQEIALRAQTDDINAQLFIVGSRGSLIQPGQAMLFGTLDNLEVGRIDTTVYRVESPEWGCLGELSVTWNWDRNFFRATPGDTGYFYQSGPNCLLYGLEPYFEVPVSEAIDKLGSVLSLATTEDESILRARMIRAVLDFFNGDVNAAGAQVLELADIAQPGSWLEAQTHAFLTASAEPNAQPLTVCAALQTASRYGACDVEQVLKRLFAEEPLERSEPIVDQLAEMGITVLDTFTISSIGRADREGVYFQLAGNHWWAFAPLDSEFYTAEPAAPPDGPVVAPPTPVIAATPPMIDALLNNDPAQVLTLLENLRRESPSAIIAADARYIEALSYDLLVNRELARDHYFELWRDSPQTIWGQLAAAHLQ